ncbi:MAG: hypothetical protein J5687_03740 [Treponema sp.]|nr:hypothetical protein [Treponema sp.]
MDYLLIGIFSVIIIALLAGIMAYNSHKKNAARLQKKTSNMQPVRCPVCQSELFVGEQLVSKVYRPMKVPDQLMTIQGCPHCYPKCEPGVSRTCPVCHKAIAPDQALTARLFNKAVGKKHVHIIGCSNCHKPRAD